MSFETESRLWKVEVGEEAARLIRLGVPPWDAMIQARQRTERKRREASAAARDFVMVPRELFDQALRELRFERSPTADDLAELLNTNANLHTQDTPSEPRA